MSQPRVRKHHEISTHQLDPIIELLSEFIKNKSIVNTTFNKHYTPGEKLSQDVKDSITPYMTRNIAIKDDILNYVFNILIEQPKND